MERAKKRIAFLGTHIVIWLYDALLKKFSKKATKTVNESDLYISPLVALEIEYLFEAGKIKNKPSPIISSLSHSVNLKVSETDLKKLVEVALTLEWTRDPFDRMLVAESYIHNAYIISKDKDIRKNYSSAIW